MCRFVQAQRLGPPRANWGGSCVDFQEGPRRTGISGWFLFFNLHSFALWLSSSFSQDGDKPKTDWEERLWRYSALGGRVQAFAAGYFIWDVVFSVTHIDVLGMESLIHRIYALLITSIGFVCLPHQESLPLWQTNNSSETFCELLRREFYSLRVINTVSASALGFGQAEHDRVEPAILERPLPSVCFLRLPSDLGLIPISQICMSTHGRHGKRACQKPVSKVCHQRRSRRTKYRVVLLPFQCGL